MEAGKRLLSDIFNGSRILEIPFFQRAYVWRETEWQRLLEDMLEASKPNNPYFMGSVILKQKGTSTGALSGDVRTLIDGQQRLTTLNIFFKVLCLKIERNDLFDGRFKLMQDRTIAIKHNHNDIEAFEKIVGLGSLEDIENKIKSQIVGAYDYFKREIDVNDFDFFNIINNLMFVVIDLNEKEDEQQIFDTINSLGVRLTTAELLKNFLFSRDDIKSYEDNWRNVFEADSDAKEFWDHQVTAGRVKRENIDLFFYAFLQIKIQDKKYELKSDDRQKLGKFSNLFENFKEFIKLTGISKHELIDEIKDYAQIFRVNFDYEVNLKELTHNYGIDRINGIIFGLEQTVLIPYILYVLKNSEQDEQLKIFQYLESFIMRRLIARYTTKNYNNLFSETLLANEANTLNKLKILIKNRSDIQTAAVPDNQELKNSFHASVLTNKQAAGVLYFIESKIRNRSKHSTGLLGLSNYTLEHLMPKKWKNHWGQLDDEQLEFERDRKLLTLGNLAIITSTLNTSIRDACWDDKRSGTGKNKGLNAYASSLETMEGFLSKENWDEQAIEERAEFLYQQALSVWEI